MRRLTINLDSDGVIYDFNAQMVRMGEHYLERELGETSRWEMHEAWGVTQGQWYAMFMRAVHDAELFRMGRALPGAIAGVKELSKKHRVRIVTAKRLRDPLATRLAMLQTINWYSQEGMLQGVEMCFTQNKQGYQADVVVDDKPTLRWAQSGALNLLFDQPWNQELFEKPFTPPVKRVHDWDEVLEFVEELSQLPANGEDLPEGAGGG